jgi:hypothetical protein
MKKFILSLMGLAIAASAYAVTPADPTNVSWYDSHSEDGFSRLNYSLPQTDTEGNELPNLRNLGFRVFTDNDQLFTFEASVYPDLSFDMTEIYYWIYAETGYDFNGDHTYFYRTNWEGFEPFFTWRIGIQAVYDDNGTKTYSNIVYTEVFPQATLPKPATPELDEFIDYGLPVGINLAYTIPHTWMTNPQLPVADDYTMDKEFDEDDPEYGNYTILDPDKVSFSLFTDNGQIFTFTPELFPGQVTEPITRFPYNSRTPNGSIGYSDMHIELTNLVDEGEEPFFTWRIGIQTYYTDNGQTSESDLLYMEVYPQLKEAAEVTSTSFLADWSCDAEDTYILAGFQSYELYVVDKATQEVVLLQNVAPTNPIDDDHAIPGAFYTVEGLTPGNTYQFYVVCSDSYNSFNSVVREVTLPTSDDHFKPGDVNHDQVVDIDDVTAVIAKVLGNDVDICPVCADVNDDHGIDIDDVTAIINIILGSN